MLSLVVDCELINDVEITHHNAKLTEGDFTIEIGVGLYNGTVDELLELDIIQVVSDHHFQDLEQFTIRDEAVVVDVVDLESKSKFVLLACTSRQRVESLDELKEGNVAVVVTVEHSDHSSYQGVVGQFCS